MTRRKVAVITGGGRGLGCAISTSLAKQEFDIAIIFRNDQSEADNTAKIISTLNKECYTVKCDITDELQVVKAIGKIIQHYGQINVLVNNAGKSYDGSLEEIDIAIWNLIITTNLTSTFLVSRAVMKAMKSNEEHLNIINIGAASAYRPFKNSGAYGPCKAAIVNLTGQMALEWASLGVKVNCICPGPIKTAESKEFLEDHDTNELIKKIPINRVAEPSEIADVVAFLASAKASYINGESIVVDGGSVHSWYLNDY